MWIGLSALAAIAAGVVGVWIYRSAQCAWARAWRSSPWFEKVVLVGLLSVCVLFGGEKTRSGGNGGRGEIVPPGVTAEAIAQGWRLESVATNDAASYAMPTNGVEYGPWSLRGGRDTHFALDLGDFAFPFGTGVVRRLDVLSGGMVESLPRQRVEGRYSSAMSICAAREQASIVPGVSRFWRADAARSASGPYQAKLLTWENVFGGRDRTGQYNAQIELFENGDFTTRSNDVERIYRRVEPFDWDGDGLENSVDPDPLVAGADAHGTNAEWYNVVCSNVFIAVEGGAPASGDMRPPGLILSPRTAEVNADAYYFVEVVAERGPAPIYFVADGASRLGDPIVVARAGETNHVPLLIGASYSVTSTMPFAVNAPTADVEVASACGGGFEVRWPVTFSFERAVAADGSAEYSFQSSPAAVDAALASVSGACCVCETNRCGFAWRCGEGCGCGGVGRYVEAEMSWEAYSCPTGLWGRCECGGGAQGGDSGAPVEPHLVLDMPQTLFTDNDGGAEASDVVELVAGLESPVATNGIVELMLLSTHSPECVKVWTSSNRTGRVEGGMSWDVAEMPKRRLYVEGAHVSGLLSGDSLRLQWKSHLEVVRQELYREPKVYCPMAEPVNCSVYDHGDLCNPSGMVVGTNACFAVDFAGESEPSGSEIVWSVAEGSARFVGGDTGKRVRVASDVPDQCVRIRAQVGDCRSRPIEFKAFVVEPVSVKTTVWIVGDDDGEYYACDAATVSNMMADVNKIYEQIGVSFYIDSISFTNSNRWLNLEKKDDTDERGSGCDLPRRRELVNVTKASGGIELYFIDNIAERKVANHDEYGIVLSTNATARVIAHEIGHSFGLADAYPFQKHKPHAHLPEPLIREQNAPDDWSNGEGHRYYRKELSQEGLIWRLLMCGYDEQGGRDLSFGMIYGYAADDVDGMTNVGFFSGNSRRTPIPHN